VYPDTSTRYGTEATPHWRDLILRIRAIQMELKRDAPERSIGLAGNPAAPESALVVAELRLGRKLPPSYREFLGFCDGWPNFFEGASLLGTGEIGRRSCEAAAARMLPERCLLPFGTDTEGACLFAFDTRVRLVDGELPVIAWLGGLGLDCKCFTGFLATMLQLRRAELAQVKARSQLMPGAPNSVASARLSRARASGDGWQNRRENPSAVAAFLAERPGLAADERPGLASLGARRDAARSRDTEQSTGTRR